MRFPSRVIAALWLPRVDISTVRRPEFHLICPANSLARSSDMWNSFPCDYVVLQLIAHGTLPFANHSEDDSVEGWCGGL